MLLGFTYLVAIMQVWPHLHTKSNLYEFNFSYCAEVDANEHLAKEEGVSAFIQSDFHSCPYVGR